MTSQQAARPGLEGRRRPCRTLRPWQVKHIADLQPVIVNNKHVSHPSTSKASPTGSSQHSSRQAAIILARTKWPCAKLNAFEIIHEGR